VGDKPFRRERIKNTLLKYLSEDALPTASQRRIPRVLKQFVLRTEVTISNEKTHSTLSVTASDRPGLLAVLAGIFFDMDIVVISSKITTLGERVEDVFQVSKNGGPVLSDANNLMDRICQELDSHVEKVAV
jgi:[protein-PII] uridylyltransferase